MKRKKKICKQKISGYDFSEQNKSVSNLLSCERGFAVQSNRCPILPWHGAISPAVAQSCNECLFTEQMCDTKSLGCQLTAHTLCAFVTGDTAGPVSLAYTPGLLVNHIDYILSQGTLSF